jgi:hypothetical protein
MESWVASVLTLGSDVEEQGIVLWRVIDSDVDVVPRRRVDE